MGNIDMVSETAELNLLAWAFCDVWLGDRSLHIDHVRIARALAGAANAGDEVALRWISRMERYGVTSSLLSDLCDAVRCVDVEYRPEFDRKGRRLYWARKFSGMLSHDAVIALFVMTVVNNGLADKLMRCQSKDCRNYQFRDTRSKWCSDRCGTRERVRAKRKRDTELLLNEKS